MDGSPLQSASYAHGHGTLTTPLDQDLKDFGREAGSVSYADIDRDVPGEGSVLLSPFSSRLSLTRYLP